MLGYIYRMLVAFRPIWLVILISLVGMALIEASGQFNDLDGLWIVGWWAALSIASFVVACGYVFIRWLLKDDSQINKDA